MVKNEKKPMEQCVDHENDQTRKKNDMDGKDQVDKVVTDKGSQNDYPYENPPQQDPPFLFGKGPFPTHFTEKGPQFLWGGKCHEAYQPYFINFLIFSSRASSRIGFSTNSSTGK